MKNSLARIADSLSFRIALASSLSLAVVVAVVVVAMVSRLQRSTIEDHQRREDEETARLAIVLSRFGRDLQRSLEVVSSQLDRATLGRQYEVGRILEARPVLRSLFSNVFVASADGRMLAFGDEHGVRKLEFNLAGRSFFEQTIKERRPTISDPAPGRLSGTPVVVLSHPLQDGDGVYGLLGGGLRLTSRDLLAELVDRRTEDRNALIVVTDSRGVIIAHPQPDMLLKTLDHEPRLSKAFAAQQAAKSRLPGQVLSRSQPGEIVSAVDVAGTRWSVWRTRPADELLAPTKAATRMAVAWATVLVLSMTLIALLLLMWLLRPLKLLTQRSQHLFNGVLPANEGWPDATGEIGRLSAVLKKASLERETLEGRNSVLLRRLASVMAASPIGIAFTRHQRFELVSKEFCRQIGRPESEMLHQPARIIYADPADYATLGAKVGEAFRAGQPFVGVLRMVRGDGSTFWGRLSGNPVDSSDATAGTIWCLTDVTEEKAAQEELEWTATHDALTGLFNRRAFVGYAERVASDSSRTQPAALIAIDLDHFKPINDLSGHAAGDAILRVVAAAMQTAVRAHDFVARVGGDEFAVVLTGCEETAAQRVAESLLSAVSNVALDWEGKTLSVGASIGVAVISPQGETFESWLERADSASYAAKRAGRGCIQLALPEVAKTAD